MKLAHKEVEEANKNIEGPPKKLVCTCKWIAGFITLVIASVLMLAALPFADMVLLSQAWPISIVFNVFLSIKFLDEKFLWKYDLSALALILCGCCLTINLSNMSTLVIDREVAFGILYSPSCAVYAVTVGVIIACAILSYCRFLRKSQDFITDAYKFRFNEEYDKKL
jgi:hypothetical protein